MKRLVLGALLAVAVSAGCTAAANDTLVTMNWQFTHLANNSARSCPTGYDTVTVVAQATDPVTYLPTGRTYVDKFDCRPGDSEGSGTVRIVLDGTYIVWAQVENHDGSLLYAKSAQTFIDTLDGDQSIDVEILDDGGYFFLTWDLETASGAPRSCSQAGIGPNGSVSVLTSLASSSSVITDKFTCEDHFGTTAGLLEGDYDITVKAVNNGTLGVADPISALIHAPNKLTPLGNIIIPLD